MTEQEELIMLRALVEKRKLLKDFHGYLTTDAYKVYEYLGNEDIRHNLCESHIRPFATGRRSWLFADTPKGATASAVAYTLAESAKANGLNVYEYFRHILMQMPTMIFKIIRKKSNDYFRGRMNFRKNADWHRTIRNT